jgi:Ca2+-binding EF-hand superfamily protein
MRRKTLAILAAAAVVVPAVASAETPAGHKDARIDRLFSRLDLNKDGKITRAELKQYREAQFKAADTDGNGSLNSIEVAAYVKAQMMERLNARFAALDKNKDGKITLDEMRSRDGQRARRGERRGAERGEHRGARRDGHHHGVRYGMSRGRRATFMFWRMDRNGDGAVTKEEFMQAAQRRMTRRVAFLFARLDDNRNGIISRDEFVDAPNRLFRRFDANDDGVVTREEVQTAMANFRHERRERRWGREHRHHGYWRHRDGWGGERHSGMMGRGEGRGMMPYGGMGGMMHRGGGWPQDN